jgi:hypothetical protein
MSEGRCIFSRYPHQNIQIKSAKIGPIFDEQKGFVFVTLRRGVSFAVNIDTLVCFFASCLDQ